MGHRFCGPSALRSSLLGAQNKEHIRHHSRPQNPTVRKPMVTEESEWATAGKRE
jgi:hypothetical protein